ncbi:MAG: hypothetical protein JWM80_2497 [Cyanobacteria bacterium RYN_339]|nr:hypothetical protein [Cyanobacteria bacterium RYN_339]
MADVHFKLWSASENGAEAEADRLLVESQRREEPALVDLGHGAHYWGWHPVIGRFVVSRRAEGAPAHLPAYLARLAEANHVHAGGTSAEDAVSELLALFASVAARLEGS